MGILEKKAVGALVVLTLTASLGLASSAPAAAPELLTGIPADQRRGVGAGELIAPAGIGADPTSGHIYISESGNNRISEYTAWGFFVESWGWGVADGSPRLQTCGPVQPEEDPDPTLCRTGSAGAGDGQLSFPSGLAVDAAGDVYVFEVGNLRVQKFSADGEFLLMFGGGVNKTKVDEGAPAADRNVCPVDVGDVCQAGTSGEGPSQLGSAGGDYLAYSNTANAIVVGDTNGIQLFDIDGNYRERIGFEGGLAEFAGQSVNSLDVDGAGNIYFSLVGVEDFYKVNPSGVPLLPGEPGESKFEASDPVAVAVDVEGSVFTANDPPGSLFEQQARITKFDGSGNQLVPTKEEEEREEFFPFLPFQGPEIRALATHFCEGSEAPGNLYVALHTEAFSTVLSHVNAYGTPPSGCEAFPKRPPEVVTQFASSVSRHEATVRAQINPLFWPDATYFVEYGTAKCSDGGCDAKAPVSELPLIDKSVNRPISTAPVLLEDLVPDTSYYYRFVAESGGGGPVFGIDPDGRHGPALASPLKGLEGSFRTFRAPVGADPCANDAIRKDFSAQLPDCRAYEMVSPLDKGNGDVALWRGRNGISPHFFELHQSASAGDRFTYSSAFAFADPASAPFVSQYLADRTAEGWTSKALSPPRTESPVGTATLLSGEFQGFGETLCHAWLRHYSVAPLTDDAVPEYVNGYRRNSCGEGPTYRALTTEAPSNRAPSDYVLRTQGFSADGEHAVFVANGKLSGAPGLDGFQLLLYERAPGGFRFVCYLPNGKAISQACSAGTAAGSGAGAQSSVHNAVSADGSRIFWTSYAGSPGFGTEPGAPGQIFVRIDGKETRKVSTSTDVLDPAWFWTASDDGSKAIIAFDSGSLKDRLYEVDVDSGTPRLIAQSVEGPLGASEDASRIYFASKEDLDAGGAASAGGHNLYLYEADPEGGGGDFTFVMALGAVDIGGTDQQPSPIDEVPSQRAAQVSPDGLHAVFVSSVSPAAGGFDNLDANSGKPSQEVYLYDAASDQLRCVSCNPSGARPVADDVGGVPQAARIQGWEALLHAPRVVSDDGRRAFFESFEALTPRDTNGTWDVYQWEEPGKGTCKVTSDTYSDVSGGCVDLISDGTSSADSIFLDADPSGDNVFFSTQSSLVEADYGLNDVYVARVGGGFMEHRDPVPCDGDACQSPPPGSPEVIPPTETSSGPGNLVGEPKPRRCPKGKRKVRRGGKIKCVKRKAKAGARRKARR